MTTAYATPAELAVALRITATEENTPLLDVCLLAAAEEIDQEIDRVYALPDPPPAIIQRVNVNRAVEWFKAVDTQNFSAGFEEIKTTFTPASGFDRYRAVLLPFKERWGIA